MKGVSKDIYKKYQAQTFPYPSLLEISEAKGSYITDVNGKKYLDFVAGVSACSIGHSNNKVVDAVKKQIDKYAHVMVYGEYMQKPQYSLAKLLAENLPEKLSTTYFTNSGAEAIEGAIKLSKRINSRSEIISCKDSYHGSTHGALSVMGNEHYKAQYRPLLPECNQIIYNDIKSLEKISKKTAAVIIESIQGASGFIVASNKFLVELNKVCKKYKVLIIFDEIQTVLVLQLLFGFEQTKIIPDIICIAKGMGGGMPIGAFISSWDLMNLLTFEPKLGHITTFKDQKIKEHLGDIDYYLNQRKVDDFRAIEKKEKVKVHIHKKIFKNFTTGLMLSIDLIMMNIEQ